MFSRIYKYHHELNSYDVIKFIAIIAMIIDHIGVYFVTDNDYFRVIGRLAAPLFFFITGYLSYYKIKAAILIYGLILTVALFYLEDELFINILIVFVLIKWTLSRWDPSQFSTALLIFLFFLSFYLNLSLRSFVDYGLLGFAYAFCGRLQAAKSRPVLVSFLLIMTFFDHLSYRLVSSDWPVATLVAIIVLLLFITMLSFQYRIFSVPTFIKNPILILSRYSLEIYFWHVLMFSGVTFYLKS